MRSSRAHRITALETRVGENEQSFSETQYKLLRTCVRLDINMTKVIRHLDIEPSLR
jgi:hypothetical protein